MGELLSVARIYGGYAVILADDARLDDTDLEPGSILAAFPTEYEARQYSNWLTILRAGYHGARAVHR